VTRPPRRSHPRCAGLPLSRPVRERRPRHVPQLAEAAGSPRHLTTLRLGAKPQVKGWYRSLEDH
jgi:hypothetical protein